MQFSRSCQSGASVSAIVEPSRVVTQSLLPASQARAKGIGAGLRDYTARVVVSRNTSGRNRLIVALGIAVTTVAI